MFEAAALLLTCPSSSGVYHTWPGQAGVIRDLHSRGLGLWSVLPVLSPHSLLVTLYSLCLIMKVLEICSSKLS